MLEPCLLLNSIFVQYSCEDRTVVVNNRLVDFTRTEYPLLRLALTKKVVAEVMLIGALELQKMDAAAHELVIKYLNQVRRKLAIHDLYIDPVISYTLVHDPERVKRRKRISVRKKAGQKHRQPAKTSKEATADQA